MDLSRAHERPARRPCNRGALAVARGMPMSVNARAMKRLGIAGKRRKDRRRITGSQGTLPPTHPGEGKIRRKPCLLVAEERNDAK